ncbi:MAG: hypothetical protein KF739_02930 [Cryobacterium sp.]|nr:hypothetical protein [Cryobacterium sp.]
MNGTRALALNSAAAAVVTATMLLTGCSPAAPPAGVAPMFEHIHELVVDPNDGALLVATHEGLYRLTIDSDGTAAAVGPVAGLDFDPMGFTIADGTAYASGHPGPTTPDSFGSPNLGLITSTDSGETWTNVSLTGITDFHGLTVMTGDGTPQVFGYDGSKGRIERSLDGGVSWDAGAELAARDILAVGDQLYATTPDGLAVSSDGGLTFVFDDAAPKLYVVAADTAGTIAGVDTSGTLWTRTPGQDWAHGHTVTGTPQAFAVDGTRLYVADDRGIALTDDAGATWTVVSVHT